MISISDKFSESVSHGFFSRHGGYSSGLYSSLNCSKFVGDDNELVLKNLATTKNKLQAKTLLTLKQVHGTECLNAIDESVQDFEADAMVTNVKGIALGVLTADCAPILMADEENGVIGAAHAGWKGALRGVIQSTVASMCKIGGDLKKIKVAIGPCIGKNSYEITEDFMKEFKGSGSCFCIVKSRLHFDLAKYCLEKLIEAGIERSNIDVLNIDTYANADDYFSFRFANQNSGGVCGRNLSAICLR